MGPGTVLMCYEAFSKRQPQHDIPPPPLPSSFPPSFAHSLPPTCCWPPITKHNQQQPPPPPPPRRQQCEAGVHGRVREHPYVGSRQKKGGLGGPGFLGGTCAYRLLPSPASRHGSLDCTGMELSHAWYLVSCLLLSCDVSMILYCYLVIPR